MKVEVGEKKAKLVVNTCYIDTEILVDFHVEDKLFDRHSYYTRIYKEEEIEEAIVNIVERIEITRQMLEKILLVSEKFKRSLEANGFKTDLVIEEYGC